MKVIIAILTATVLLSGCKNREETVRTDVTVDSAVQRQITERTIDTAIKVDRKEALLNLPPLEHNLNTVLSQTNAHATVTAVVEGGKVTSVECTCDSLKKQVKLKEREISELKLASTNTTTETTTSITQAIPWYYKLSMWISILSVGYVTTKLISKFYRYV